MVVVVGRLFVKICEMNIHVHIRKSESYAMTNVRVFSKRSNTSRLTHIRMLLFNVYFLPFTLYPVHTSRAHIRSRVVYKASRDCISSIFIIVFFIQCMCKMQ